MFPDDLISALRIHGDCLGTICGAMPSEQALWRPAPEKWCLLEIFCHLVDEEREDFRARLALTLEDPEQPWPSIDPVAWVRQRDYTSRDLETVKAEFRRERERSLEWLHGLQDPAWDNVHVHALLGDLRAGDLLAAWVAHDALHSRQVANLRLAWVKAVAAPYSPLYAAP